MTSLTRRSWLLGGAAFLAQAAPVRLPQAIKVGIIGFEGHTAEVTGPLPLLPDVAIAACATPDDAAWERQKSPAIRSSKRYRDYREMLQQEKLDVAAVCNDDGSRAEAVIACLDHGLHVAAEKPLGVNASELAAIRAALKRSGKRLTMLLPMRYSPPFLALRNIVQSGAIGEVIQMEAQKSYQIADNPEWKRHARSYGSTILWIGPHLIDCMRFTSGRELNVVSARQSHVGFPEIGEMENSSVTLFSLDNGGNAVMHVDFLRPAKALTHGDDRLRLVGSSGIAEYQEHTGVTVLTEGNPRPITSLPSERFLFAEFLDSVYNHTEPSLSEADVWRINELTLAADAVCRHPR